MKISKFYISADDDIGAYVYTAKPLLGEDGHTWTCLEGDLVEFIAAKDLTTMGLDIEALKESPHEVIVIY